MSIARRSILTLFLSAAAAPAAFAADVYVPQLTDDERLTISTMAERGIPDFIMMNEKQGLIKLIRGGQVYLVSPAASGAVKGDDAQKNPRVTPAGVFPLTDFGDDKYIGYYTLGKNAYLIHATTPRRDNLLAGNNPNNFRASDGCIAVPRPVFSQFLNFIRQGGEKTLVVLPEEQDIRTVLGLRKAGGPAP